MYASLTGIIEKKYKDRVVVNVNDVGYEVYMPESEILNLNENNGKIKINTHLQVKEDDMKLFGFLEENTLEFFKKLITVSGVGPKVALGIISNISVSQMCIAIATENVVTLKSIPGVGPKMAQKIIFELKDKVQKENMDKIASITDKKVNNNINIDEAIIALEVLGYNKKDIKNVILKLNLEGKTVEEIIKEVLKNMQKK